MSDIVVEIKNTERLYELLDLYIDAFFKEPHWSGEKYKWEAVKHFQNVWHDVNDNNFVEKLNNALSKTDNLLNQPMSYPRKTILDYAKDNRTTLKTKCLFDLLALSENRTDYAKLIKEFQNGAEEIKGSLGIAKKLRHYQTNNAITTYLWLMFPNTHFIYKYREYKNIVDKLEVVFKGKADNVAKCYALYGKICELLKNNNRYAKIKNIIEECKDKTGFEDKGLCLFVSDFAYYVRAYLGEIVTDNGNGGDNMVINQPKNLILYGPPGTGKTYSTILKAMQIIEPAENYNNDNYDEAVVKFKEYLHTNRLEFVTFHQSYSYEDFIDGIKAKTKNGQVVYEVEDGIFKKFCDDARGAKVPCVFIIDEINRGNISKIFGEIITLIEEDKREDEDNELSVILPYPDNSGKSCKVFYSFKHIYHRHNEYVGSLAGCCRYCSSPQVYVCRNDARY